MKLISNFDNTVFVPLSEVSKFDISEFSVSDKNKLEVKWILSAHTKDCIRSVVVARFNSKREAVSYLMTLTGGDDE